MRSTLGDPLGEFDNPCDRHLALEGTTEGRRHRDLRADACLMRRRCDLQPGRDRLQRADALVAAVEGVAGDDGHADLVATGRRGPLKALLVQHQPDVPDALAPGQRGQHLLGVGHLRHALRVDEAGDLEAARAAGDQALDERDLRGRGHHPRFALQAIARPDFDDLDALAHDDSFRAGGTRGFPVILGDATRPDHRRVTRHSLTPAGAGGTTTLPRPSLDARVVPS